MKLQTKFIIYYKNRVYIQLESSSWSNQAKR